MAKIPFDIVGFDLDGTLLDTSRELTAAVNHTLALAGRPTFSVAEVRPMIGRGARHMLDMGLERSGGSSRDLLEKWLPVLLDYYDAHIGNDSPPFPGLIEALDTLDEMGVRIAVVTNKYERFASKLLDRIGMAERFDCIIGGDTMGPGKAKPHRAPIDEMIRRCGGSIASTAAAAFVGDSEADTGAARAACIPSIAVSFGFLTGPVEQLGADAVIHHYDELLPTLIRLG